MLDLGPLNVVQTKTFKCYILDPNGVKVSINLVLQESSLQIFKRKIVKFEYSKISSQEEGVFIRFKLFFEGFTVDPSERLEYHSRDVQCDKVD